MRWYTRVGMLLMLLSMLGGVGQVVLAAQGLVWVADNLAKVRRDEAPPATLEPRLMRLESAQNEWESGQVIVHALGTLDDVTVSVTPLVHESGQGPDIVPSLFRQHYIQVTTPTSVFPTGWYPDALLPHAASIDVPSGQNQGFWVSVNVPSHQPPGTYRGTITVSMRSGEETQTVDLPVELVVWDFALPDASHTMSAFAVWGDQVARYHGITPRTPRYWEVLENYYWFQTEYRLPPTDLPITYASPEQFVEDAARFLSNPKVSSFRIPFVVGDLQQTKRVVDLLRERGWLSKGYFYLGHLIDEPTPDQYDDVRMYSEQLKSIAPDVPHVVTTQPVDPLFGAVNTWAANLRDYDPQVARIRQDLGEGVWWYTAVVPRYPFPSYHIDDDLISARLLSWYQWNWNVEGVLYWSTTIFEKWAGSGYVPRNVWEDPLAFPGSNGDGFLLYPWIDGPVASIRLETLRDGMEDFEYLWLLQERLLEVADRLGVELTAEDIRQTVAFLFDNLFASAPRVLKRDTQLLQAARRQLARWIALAGSDPLHLLQLRPRENQLGTQELLIWASPDASVTIDGQPLEPTSSSDQANFYSLVIGRGEHHVVEVVGNGKVHRHELDSAFYDRPSSRTYSLSSFETPSDLNRLEPRGVQVDLASEHVTHGASNLVATFAANTDFPNMLYEVRENGAVPAEWTQEGYFVFDVWNDGETMAEFYVKFHASDGTSHDQTAVTVAPHTWRRVEVPLEAITLDRSRLDYVEFWMWRRDRPMTLHFDNFYLEVVGDEHS